MKPKRRAWFDWHSLIGMTTGMILFIICWTGTTAVFSYEIDWLLNEDLRAGPAAGRLNWDALETAARQALPDADILWIEAPRVSGYAAAVVADFEPGVAHRVYVDPETYSVLGDTSYLNVQRFFRSFHMALFQADFFSVFGIPVGYFIVLLFAVPLLGLMVTGLVFYKRWWRGFWKLETRRGSKVLWSDVHKLAGVWSLPLVAIITVTNIWYAAEWFIPPTEFKNEQPEIARTLDQPLTLNAAASAASRAIPGLDIRSVYLPEAGSSVLLLQGHDGGLLTRGRAQVEIDLATGMVQQTVPSSSLGPVARLKETVDVLHFGTWAGVWSQALYAFLGLGLSSLALTGTFLYACRRTDKGVLKHRELIAALGLTLAVLAICSIAGWNEIAGYGLSGSAPAVGKNVVVFLVGWCVITFSMLIAVAALAAVKLSRVGQISDHPHKATSGTYS